LALYKIVDVPRIKQKNDFSCWYASACMVLYCFEIGPRQGIPEEYAKSKTEGLTNSRWAELAQIEGLRTLKSLADSYLDDTKNAAKQLGTGNPRGGFTLNHLAQILDSFGPIWTVIGGRHAVVVTGVEDDRGGTVQVIYNDPADASEKRMPLTRFNDPAVVGWQDASSMLCYPPRRYPGTNIPWRAPMLAKVSVSLDVFTMTDLH
jgi:hypothetical protein